MTTTSDPHHPKYTDEADTRLELARVFDVCAGCRRCVSLCESFPTMFDIVDALADHDAGRMTPAQQDRVADGCIHCGQCAFDCPYGVGRHHPDQEAVDMPALMLRAQAMRAANGQLGWRQRVTTQVLGRAEAQGVVASRIAPLADRVLSREPGSPARKVAEKVTGIASVRLVPPLAKQRFSTWFKRRPRVRIGQRRGRVALFPTCLVEYHEPAIGHDLVKVYERNGVEVTLADPGCCGAPWLHAGDIEHFRKQARGVVTALAVEARRGNDIVVPQPTCSYTLKHDYPKYLPGPDADIVAEHTFDSSEYLMRIHRAGDTTLDTDFEGDVPAVITYHAPCHLRAQNIGLRSRDLLKLTGATVRLVQQCSGMGAMAGLRADRAETSLVTAAKLGERISTSAGEAVAGDCHLANTVIAEQTGRVPAHPMQLVARAYGIAEEDPPR